MRSFGRYWPERYSTQVYIRACPGGFMAVASARPDGRPPCRLRGYGPTRGLALQDMLSCWEKLSPFTVPQAPMRVYDETSGDIPIKGCQFASNHDPFSRPIMTHLCVENGLIHVVHRRDPRP